MKPGIGVGILIIKDNKILLGLRNPDKVKAGSELNGEGTWSMTGGKVEYMEKLVDAARRATYSAYLKYLPTLRMDLGYQTYDDQYAKSYTDVPTHVGQFTFGIDQMIYAPDLVTNIIVKHKKLKFDKAEKVLKEVKAIHELVRKS